jgi:flagellar biosynthesis/type III secretory pathway chaperone
MLHGPDQFRAELKRLLGTQAERAQQLLGTLESERDALADGDAERLDTLTRQKSSLLQGLEDVALEQKNLIDGLALEDGDLGLETALAWCDPGSELKSTRQTVGKNLERCRELNERNGLTVQYRMGYVRRALNVLNGDSAGNSGIYGRDGRTTGNVHSRLLASG